jgi:hypothetical protein
VLLGAVGWVVCLRASCCAWLLGGWLVEALGCVDLAGVRSARKSLPCFGGQPDSAMQVAQGVTSTVVRKSDSIRGLAKDPLVLARGSSSALRTAFLENE